MGECGWLEVAVEREQVGEAGRLDHPHHAACRPPELESPTLGREALLGLNEEAQAGRVDEPDAGQVDDDRVATLAGEVAEGRAQRRGRSELEVASEGHDRGPGIVNHLDGDDGRTLGAHATRLPAGGSARQWGSRAEVVRK